MSERISSKWALAGAWLVALLLFAGLAGGMLAVEPAYAVSGSVTAGALSEQATKSKPAKAKVTSVKSAAAGKLTVKVGKVSGAKGYQYQVALDKKMTQGVVKKTASKRTVTFKKLKQGKKYYVRVRAYKVSNGKKAWGAWSSVKKATVKKDLNSAFVGKWELVKMRRGNVVTDKQAIDQLKLRGMSVSLNLSKNGTLSLDLFGTKMIGTWAASSAKSGEAEMNGQYVSMKRSGSTLTLSQSDSSLTFAKV